jgi:WD40 repeat protein
VVFSTKRLLFIRNKGSKFLGKCVVLALIFLAGCSYLPSSNSSWVELQPNEQPLGSVGEFEQIDSILISPDSSLLLVIRHGQPLQLIRRQTREILRNFQTKENYPINPFILSFSPDSRTIAGISQTNQILLWNASSDQPKTSMAGHKQVISGIAFSRDGKSLASSSYDKTVKIWDTKTGQLKQTLSVKNPVFTLIFSETGKVIHAADTSGTVYQWNASTGQLIRTIANPQNQLQTVPITLDDSVYAVVFSPDGKLMARRDADKNIRIWNLESGNLVSIIQRDNELSYTMTFSPNGQTLATVDESKRRELLTGGSYHVLRLWNTQTGRLIARSNNRQYILGKITFNPNRNELFTGGLRGNITQWDFSEISNQP